MWRGKNFFLSYILNFFAFVCVFQLHTQYLIFGELKNSKKPSMEEGRRKIQTRKKCVLCTLDAMFSWPKMSNEKIAPTQVNISRCVFNFINVWVSKFDMNIYVTISAL